MNTFRQTIRTRWVLPAIAFLLLVVLGILIMGATGRQVAHAENEHVTNAVTGVLPGGLRVISQRYQGCPPSGAPGGLGQFTHPALDLLKNRVGWPSHITSMNFRQFLALHWPRSIDLVPIRPMSSWSASTRRSIYPREMTGATLTGYVTSFGRAGPEPANCNGRAGVDWHIYIGPIPGASRAASVITEVTPRTRGAESGFSFAHLSRLLLRGTRVRVTGWLFLDYVHANRVGTARATLWELHPITRIQIQRGRSWVTVAEGP